MFTHRQPDSADGTQFRASRTVGRPAAAASAAAVILFGLLHGRKPQPDQIPEHLGLGAAAETLLSQLGDCSFKVCRQGNHRSSDKLGHSSSSSVAHLSAVFGDSVYHIIWICENYNSPVIHLSSKISPIFDIFCAHCLIHHYLFMQNDHLYIKDFNFLPKIFNKIFCFLPLQNTTYAFC